MKAGIVIVPAQPGWVGLYKTDGQDPIWFCGNVVAWKFDTAADADELDAVGITEYGEAHYVVAPDGSVTETGASHWSTLNKFLSKNIVDMETVEILRSRFPCVS